MHQQDTLQSLRFELKPPSQQARGEGWNREESCRQQVEISCVRLGALFGPGCRDIRSHSDEEQGYREVNEDSVLRVLGK